MNDYTAPRRLVALGVVVAVMLAGCTFIPTPTGPGYRYSWVMLHDFQREGVQVGPKFDGSGIHWSVYWWIDCDSNYVNCTGHDFIPGEHIDPNVPHWYAIPECEPGVWCPMVDGRIVARVPLPYPPAVRELGSEVTRA